MDFEYTNENWRDQLTKVNDKTITYDAIGNPLNDGTWTYTWQNGRQLQKMQKSGETVEFVYNENGLRVQKTATSTGVTQYTLHGKNIVHMTQGSNELHFFYDAQNKPAVVVYNGTAYSYVKNLQGDIIAILDSDKNVVVSYVYDAWGRPISCSGTMASTLGKINPFRYRGYVYDEENGLYSLPCRYYAPSCSRWLSIEPTVFFSYFDAGACLHRYSICVYCANNPINSVDPTGKFILTAILIGAGVGAIIGGTIGGVVAYEAAKESGVEGADLFWETAKGVGKGATVGGVGVGLLTATGSVWATYGIASIGGTAMLSCTASVALSTGELVHLQRCKSSQDGDSSWQTANDCLNAVFNNGVTLVSPVFEGAVETGFNYEFLCIVKENVLSPSFNTYLDRSDGLGGAIGGIVLDTGKMILVHCYYEGDPEKIAEHQGYELE